MRKLLLPRGAVNAVYLPYLQSPRRYQIFFGGASSGKSCFLATRAVLDTLQGRSTLVIRQVARTLRTSCWNEIGKAAARLGLTGCFRFNKTEMTVTARNNGAQILFAGLDDVEKIKSISPAGGALTDIWIEEATEIKETHESDADVLRRALSEDIHKFSMVPDLTDEQFAANASGVAMRYKLLGLEQLTGVKERYFREGLRCRVRLFAHYLALLGEREIVPERVRFIFTRSLPVNDTEQAQIVRELHGIVPDEQLLPQLSFLRDFRPDASQR